MSETVVYNPVHASEPVETAEESRPWHGADNPFEALYRHFEAMRADLPSKTDKSDMATLKADMATMKADIAAVKDRASRPETVTLTHASGETETATVAKTE